MNPVIPAEMLSSAAQMVFYFVVIVATVMSFMINARA